MNPALSAFLPTIWDESPAIASGTFAEFPSVELSASKSIGMVVNAMGYGARVGLEGVRHKSGAFPRQWPPSSFVFRRLR